MVIVIDEPRDADFKIAWQVAVLQQDAVLECLMPAFDLSSCLRMIRRTLNVFHFLCFRQLIYNGPGFRTQTILVAPLLRHTKRRHLSRQDDIVAA